MNFRILCIYFFLLTGLTTIVRAQLPDLRGYDGQPGNSYYFNCATTSAAWGQNISVQGAVGNYGTGTAGSFIVDVYISETRNFVYNNPSSCWLIQTIQFNALAANGVEVFGPGNIQLPTSNPFGDNVKTFYIGMVVNPDKEVTESSYTNNQNLGAGIDSSAGAITITSQPQIVVSGSSPAGSTTALAFGNVNLNGSTSTQKVTLSNAGYSNLSVSNISVTGAGYSLGTIVSDIEQLSQPLTFPHLVPPESAEHWAINVIYTPTAIGSQTGSLVITSNDPTTPTVTYSLSGSGVAVPHLAFTNPVPSNNDNLIASYGGIANNSSLTEIFKLQNSGTAPLTISQNGIALTTTQSGVWTLVSIISSTQGAINLSSSSQNIAANGAETWSVVVKFAPTTTQGYAAGLQIFSNDPSTPTTTGAPTMTCALEGQGLTPMTISVASAVNGVTDSNPLLMNFGLVHATGQQSLSGTVTLTNTGQLPLVIAKNGVSLASSTNFQITGITSSTQGSINLSSNSGTIAANAAETWTITLLFVPTVVGTDNTSLTITSNDPSTGTESIALNGTGNDAPGLAVIEGTKVVTASATLPTINFGFVLDDGPGNVVATQTVTIENIGLEPVTIPQNGVSIQPGTGKGAGPSTALSVQSIVSSTQGPINVAAGPTTIAPLSTEKWTLTIVFDPTSQSTSSGVLRIGYPPTIVNNVGTINIPLNGYGNIPGITMQPQTAGLPTIYLPAGQVYNITWASLYSVNDSTTQITLSRTANNTIPASGLTTIATIPFNEPINNNNPATDSYAWRPDASLVGQEFYIYGSMKDGTITNGTFSTQKVHIEAANSFNLLSPLMTTSANYAYQYIYNGKAYGGTTTLQPGANIITISTPLSGGGTAVHQITVNQVSSTLTVKGYTYDEMNRVQTYTNGNGITTLYTYSLAGNLTQTSSTNGNVVNYTYDSLNRKTSMVDSTGTTFYGYDDLDRVTSITYSISGNQNDPNNLVVGYQFDNANHETQITYPNYPGGEYVNYFYDKAGRLQTIADVLNSTTTYNYTYNYNPTTGQLKTINRANGIITSYSYDNAGRLNDIKHVNSSNQTLAEYNYNSLDANGNAVNLLATLNNGSQQQTLYSYDSLQRLVQVTYGSGATAVPNIDPTVTYTYDNNGNRLTQKTTVNGAVTQLLTYSYGSANQLVQIVNQAGTLQASFVYDPAGNRVEKITPSGNTYYAYNELNLLTTVVTPNDYILYAYNGSGQRVSQNVDGVLTSFVIDPNQSVYQIIQERNGLDVVTSSINKSYVYGSDRLGSNPNSANSQFYLPDRIGSPLLVSDPNGNILSSNSYDAFGASPRP